SPNKKKSAAYAALFFFFVLKTLIHDRREENIPEGWRRRQKLHGNQSAIVAHLSRTHHAGFHRLLQLWILPRNARAFSQALRQDQHSPVFTHRVRRTLNGGFAGNVHGHGDLHQHTLRAAAFFRRQVAGDGATLYLGWVARTGCGHCRTVGFHSSSPQKSMSGAISSTPYSQPSGRLLPFHTTTAALLDCVAKFVRARR